MENRFLFSFGWILAQPTVRHEGLKCDSDKVHIELMDPRKDQIEIHSDKLDWKRVLVSEMIIISRSGICCIPLIYRKSSKETRPRIRSEF